MKRVYKSTILVVLISFEVKHRRRIFRMEKGIKGKGEGMVYVSHHCRGQGVPTEWYMS